MDVTDCGKFQVSGFDLNDFETIESSIRERVYLFYKNFQKKKNMKSQQLLSRPFSYTS